MLQIEALKPWVSDSRTKEEYFVLWSMVQLD